MTYQPVPTNYPDLPAWLRKIAVAVNGLLNGWSNNIGSVTLTASAATTVIQFEPNRLRVESRISLFPQTANAAAAWNSIYESARDVAAGTLTLTHVNNANADKTYDFFLVG